MGIIRQVLGAARQTDRWDPVRLIVRCWHLIRLAFNPTRHLKVHQALALNDLLETYPRTTFKYLGTYLARSLSVADRAMILTNHYSYLKRQIAEPSLSSILFGRLRLWEESQQPSLFGIYLAFSHPIDREGELSLIFRTDSSDVFTLSFTISPGGVLGVTADHVFLVSRLQGQQGCFEQIRNATKSFGELSPAAMLIAALEGIAQALDIQDVVGVCAQEHVALEETSPTHDFISAYDHFWLSLGARKMNDSFFHIQIPLPEKPIHLIKQHHRSRTLEKRKFKKQIADQVCQAFKDHQGGQPR